VVVEMCEKYYIYLEIRVCCLLQDRHLALMHDALLSYNSLSCFASFALHFILEMYICLCLMVVDFGGGGGGSLADYIAERFCLPPQFISDLTQSHLSSLEIPDEVVIPFTTHILPSFNKQ